MGISIRRSSIGSPYNNVASEGISRTVVRMGCRMGQADIVRMHTLEIGRASMMQLCSGNRSWAADLDLKHVALG